MPFFVSVLTVQLEDLQAVANTATSAVNAWGPSLVNRLHDVSVHVQEIALHGVHRGAAVAASADGV